MPKNKLVQSILDQAKGKEHKYDWLGAVELYKKALDQMLKENKFLKASDIEERIGYCFYRSAMQSENIRDFRDRMHLAINNYRKANNLLGNK